ncbi:MAG: hypothetical protein ACOZQL_40925 [Myxococcota bacterium]
MTRSRWSAALAALSLSACNLPEDAEVPTAKAEAALCSPVSNTDVSRSLAVTDATVLAKFSFERTMRQLLSSAQVAGTETPKTVYQRWMSSFAVTQPGVDPEAYGLVNPRQPEAALATVNPFRVDGKTSFEPIALFNRLDLAPASGATCGEYRIVYALRSTQVSGRALIIFEGALPNPHPELRVDGCLDVALFWQGLTADTDANSRAAKLEAFFYAGTAIPGVAPVVQASSYGLATNGRRTGQIRTNFFIEGIEWNLREFQLARPCTDGVCTLEFNHVTVKANPALILATDDHARSATFQSQFVRRMASLTGTDVARIGLKVNDVHNTFESISQRPVHTDYAAAASAGFKSAIAAQSGALTADDVLHRAQTQTCAGCHQASNGVNLGPGVDGPRWPPSNGFTHVNELSRPARLSLALTDVFLPHRKQVLEDFINSRCSGLTTQVEDGLTLGGSVEGAAN